MTAVLPLISPEKGTQLGFVAQGLLLVVSGVYYPVSVLPEWMQWLAKISPATYALRGCRAAIINGAGLTDLATEIWALLVIGAVSVPLGLCDLPHRRALREEAREAEAVGMSERTGSRATSPARYDARLGERGDRAVDRRDGRLPRARSRATAARSSSRSGPGGSRCRSRSAASACAGIDLSPDMVAQLRKKPGGDEIPVAIGDFATTRVDGHVLARLPRLQHDQQPDDAGRRRSRASRTRRRTSSPAAASSSRSASPTARPARASST